MTYLQIVNRVLRLMREDEVTSVTENSYSTMIGELVNSAKEVIEDSWDWTSLRTSFTVTLAAGTTEYDLTNSTQRTRVLEMYNDTQDYRINQAEHWWVEKMLLIDTDQNDPSWYSISGTNSSGELQVKFYSIPGSTDSIKVFAVNPQAELSTGSTEVLIPARPLIQLAYAMAIEERGETGGTSAVSAYSVYERHLGNAIITDSSNQWMELQFEVV